MEIDKIGPQAAGRLLSVIAQRAWQRFDENALQARVVNDRLLQQVLELNQATEYGRRYGFSRLRARADFQAAVPLTTYADYQSAIERMARGEQNVLTAEPIRYFSLTSGTTGARKMIPNTARSVRSASTMGVLTWGRLHHLLQPRWNYGRGLMLMNMVIASRTATGIPLSSGTSGGMRSMAPVIPFLWTSPVAMLRPTDKIDARYLHLRFALPEEDLAYLSAPFISTLVDLLRYLEHNWPRLVADVARGTLERAGEMPAALRGALERRLRPNPRRAAALTNEFEQGFNGIVPRLWPRLLYVNSVAGGPFSLYAEKIKAYLGSVPIYSGCYGASEGLLGISRELNRATYLLTPAATVVEFIPLAVADQDQPPTLDLDELTPGESYEVVVTGYGGLYRYRLGDVVRVVGFYRTLPEIEFLYRRNELVSLVGEKTSEPAARAALGRTLAGLTGRLVDFTVMTDIDSSPGRYIFLVEIEGDFRQVDSALERQLDHELGLANPSYGAARRDDRLAPLELKTLQPDTFAGLKSLLANAGIISPQLKIPRVVRSGPAADYLRARVVPSAEALLAADGFTD